MKPTASELLPALIRWLAVLSPSAAILGKSPADIACSIVALLFFAQCVIARDFAWAKQDWVLAALTLWVFGVTRALFMPDPGGGLTHSAPFIRYIFYAAALQSFALTEPVWRTRLALITAGTIGIFLIDALLQYATGHDLIGRPLFYERLTAFYHGPRVGIMLAWLAMPIILALVDLRKPRLAGLLALTALFVIFRSGDRMAFLLIFLYAGLFAVLIKRARLYVMAGVPLAALIAAIFFATHPGSFERQILSTVRIMQHLSETQYGAIWKSALDLGLDHPLFGAGPGAFRDLCPDPKYGPLIHVTAFDNNPRCATHPHNMYLEWFTDVGAIGLVLFLGMLGLILRRLIYTMKLGLPDWTFAGLLVVFLARLWPLTSQTSFHHAWSGAPFWLIIGWALSYTRHKDRLA